MNSRELVKLMQVVRHLVNSGTENTRAIHLLDEMIQMYLPAINNDNSAQCPSTPAPGGSNLPPVRTRIPQTSAGVRNVSDSERTQGGPAANLNCPTQPQHAANTGEHPSCVPNNASIYQPPANNPTRSNPILIRTPVNPPLVNTPCAPRRNGPPPPPEPSPSYSQDRRRGRGPQRASTPSSSSDDSVWMECPYCHRGLNLYLNLGFTEHTANSDSSHEQELRVKIRLLPETQSPSGLTDETSLFSSSNGTHSTPTLGSLRDILNQLPDSNGELNEILQSFNLQRVPPAVDLVGTPSSAHPSYLDQPINCDRRGLSNISGTPPAIRLSPNTAGDRYLLNQCDITPSRPENMANAFSRTSPPSNSIDPPQRITLQFERCNDTSGGSGRGPSYRSAVLENVNTATTATRSGSMPPYTLVPSEMRNNRFNSV